MPYTFNGCGTRFYGQQDRAADGSYVTTEWITLVYVPLIPIRSFRVLPVGKGANYVIHSSQSYQTLRVPLHWPQVRNVYFIAAPIILLVLYYNRQSIENWYQEDVLGHHPHPALQLENPKLASAEAPLDTNAAAVACGKVLKLDDTGFAKLDIVKRVSSLVSGAGFTESEIKELGDSEKNLSDEAFQAYSFAYLMWDKPAESSRSEFDKMLVKSMNGQDLHTLSADERVALEAYMAKMKSMMLRAFELGRHDARVSPCPASS
jgi:hypothetical protein